MKNNNDYLNKLLNKNFDSINKFNLDDNNNLYLDDDNNLKIINYCNFNEYINYKFTLKQLKILAKKFHLNSYKNKNILKKNIFNYLFITKNCIIIQKNIKKFFAYNFFKLKGPGLFNRSLCNNEFDFLTYDTLDSILLKDFYSFKDNYNFIYGFQINSFYNYVIKSKNKNNILNPYNNSPINKKIIDNFFKMLSYSKLLNYNYFIEDSKNINNNIDTKIFEIFQTIDSFGYNTSLSWFSNLDKINLIILVKELNDIWNYRSNLSFNVKKDISPPYGNPFANINIYKLNNLNIYQIKKIIYNIFDKLVNKGIDQSFRTLGCLYILTALTIVSNDAAESMPWLYESVNII